MAELQELVGDWQIDRLFCASEIYDLLKVIGKVYIHASFGTGIKEIYFSAHNIHIVLHPPREGALLQIVSFWPASDSDDIEDVNCTDYYIYLFKHTGTFAVYSNNKKDHNPSIMWDKNQNCSIAILEKWLKEINMFAVLNR